MTSLTRFHEAMRTRHRWYALVSELVLAIKEQQPSLLAKQAAYSLLYAIPSILIVLVSLAAIIDKNTGSGVSGALQGFIAERVPDELQPLLAIEDSRTFIKSAATRLGLMLIGGILVVAAFLLLAFGRLVLGWLPDIVEAGGILPAILASSPLWALVMLFVATVLLYWLGLDAPKSIRWLLPGAVAATVAIALLIGLLDLILSYSNPGAAYGGAGSVLILLWTLFMLSNIVVIGAIVNAVLGKRYDRKLISGLQSRAVVMPAGKRIAVSTYR